MVNKVTHFYFCNDCSVLVIMPSCNDGKQQLHRTEIIFDYPLY